MSQGVMNNEDVDVYEGSNAENVGDLQGRNGGFIAPRLRDLPLKSFQLLDLVLNAALQVLQDFY